MTYIMKRKKIFYVVLSIALLLPMDICSVVLAQFDGDAHRRAMLADPVGVVVMAHNEANRAFLKQENPSPAAILAHQQEWVERLHKIKAEHPQSEFVEYALLALWKLYNDLNELDNLQKVVRELIDVADTQEEKYL